MLLNGAAAVYLIRAVGESCMQLLLIHMRLNAAAGTVIAVADAFAAAWYCCRLLLLIPCCWVWLVGSASAARMLVAFAIGCCCRPSWGTVLLLYNCANMAAAGHLGACYG